MAPVIRFARTNRNSNSGVSVMDALFIQLTMVSLCLDHILQYGAIPCAGIVKTPWPDWMAGGVRVS